MTEDLFGAADAPEDMTRPLAVRMRPSTLAEVVGQDRVLGEGSPLRRLANPASKGSLTAPSSIILFGPPGVGKTTLAYIVAKQSGRVFEELSAVTSGVKDVRAVLQRAHERLVAQGRETVLFIDEVHRFSKSQQDALLAQRGEPRCDLHRRHDRKPELLRDFAAVEPFRGGQARSLGA
jgi:putative ATPase